MKGILPEEFSHYPDTNDFTGPDSYISYIIPVLLYQFCVTDTDLRNSIIKHLHEKYTKSTMNGKLIGLIEVLVDAMHFGRSGYSWDSHRIDILHNSI